MAAHLYKSCEGFLTISTFWETIQDIRYSKLKDLIICNIIVLYKQRSGEFEMFFCTVHFWNCSENTISRFSNTNQDKEHFFCVRTSGFFDITQPLTSLFEKKHLDLFATFPNIYCKWNKTNNKCYSLYKSLEDLKLGFYCVLFFNR